MTCGFRLVGAGNHVHRDMAGLGIVLQQIEQTGDLPLERAVQMLTSRNARHIGLHDRGTIAIGQRADLNLIDPQRLAVGTPQLVRDLPAGGRRFLQRGEGYLGTWVAGQRVRAGESLSAARPGRLVRLGKR